MLFDSPADLAPESVLNWLNVCAAGLMREEQEAFRVLVGEGSLPLGVINEVGLGASRVEIAGYFKACRQELELAAVLAMTAAAEARIRLDASSRIAREAGKLAQRLKLLAASVEVEWQIPLYKDGIVDAWQAYISSLAALPDADRARLKGAIGSFKNLLNTRHWVAHGRYWRPKWTLDRFPPRDVADMIQDLYGAFRETAAVENLMTFT